jgi:hypothetical protein
MDTATARDGEKPGTPGWRKAEAEYQDALKSYRAIAAQVAARAGPTLAAPITFAGAANGGVR